MQQRIMKVVIEIVEAVLFRKSTHEIVDATLEDDEEPKTEQDQRQAGDNPMNWARCCLPKEENPSA